MKAAVKKHPGIVKKPQTTSGTKLRLPAPAWGLDPSLRKAPSGPHCLFTRRDPCEGKANVYKVFSTPAGPSHSQPSATIPRDEQTVLPSPGTIADGGMAGPKQVKALLSVCTPICHGLRDLTTRSKGSAVLSGRLGWYLHPAAKETFLFSRLVTSCYCSKAVLCQTPLRFDLTMGRSHQDLTEREIIINRVSLAVLVYHIAPHLLTKQ